MDLPLLERDSFVARLGRVSPERLAPATIDALWVHYGLLREWSRGLSLIGRGTAGEVVERHYGESLAALPWVARGRLLDLGSGAGFPGFVLAAARPRLEVWLVEARQRKWAFLRTAVARASLPCECLNARVSGALPPGVPEELDFVTLRAVKPSPVVLATLLDRLKPAGALLWWRGSGLPALPPGWAPSREIDLPGSERRRIVEVRRAR